LNKRESNDLDSLVKEPKAKKKGATKHASRVMGDMAETQIGKENVASEPDRSVAVEAPLGLVWIHPVCAADLGGKLPPCTTTRLVIVIVLATVTVTVTVV
jgi:hypothetical protein